MPLFIYLWQFLLFAAFSLFRLISLHLLIWIFLFLCEAFLQNLWSLIPKSGLESLFAPVASYYKPGSIKKHQSGRGGGGGVPVPGQLAQDLMEWGIDRLMDRDMQIKTQISTHQSFWCSARAENHYFTGCPLGWQCWFFQELAHLPRVQTSLELFNALGA